MRLCAASYKQKPKLGLDKTRLVDINALNKKFGHTAWQAEAQDISDRGITLLSRHSASPAARRHKTRACPHASFLRPIPNHTPGEDLERELRTRFDSLTTLRADTKFVKADMLKLPSPDTYECRHFSRFLCASAIAKGNVDVPAEQAALADQLSN